MESVVAIGASAGGIEAVGRLLADLPEDLGAAVLVVVHTAATAGGKLPQVLGRYGVLTVEHARDGEALEANRVYVAPPDHHLLVSEGHARVVRGPRENLHRPAIDPLLRSAAIAYGGSAVAVILTGSLDDGAAGSAAVTRMGGTVLVQDPAEARFPSMPRSAIAADSPAAVLPLAELGAAVVQAIPRSPAGARDAPEDSLLGREA